MREQEIYRLEDPGALAEIVAGCGLALLCSTGADGPVVSHVPVVLEHDGASPLSVVGHLPRADALAHGFGAPAVLVVAGPDAYVSPRWYGEGTWLPTWNYVVVHVHGHCEALDDAETYAVLERTVVHHETRAGTHWELAGSRVYAEQLLAQITGFRFVPARVVAKAKLSQDKPPAAFAGVLAALDADGGAGPRAVASWMRRLAPPGLAPAGGEPLGGEPPAPEQARG